jgi:hypothetical protein
MGFQPQFSVNLEIEPSDLHIFTYECICVYIVITTPQKEMWIFVNDVLTIMEK